MNRIDPADNHERRKVSELIPYAKNSRTHSEEQVAQIAASIKEWGFTNPVLVDPEGGIIAGHGRVLAAQKLKLDTVPCIIAEGWTGAQKRAYVIADNKLALNAGWDDDILKLELQELTAIDFDLALTGFSLPEIADILSDDPGQADSSALSDQYTRKIEAPIYEITGACPDPHQLYDRSKTEALLSEIQAADLPEAVRTFLAIAAERHTQFNFRQIAEFYAHAPAETQDLMERSALVIIDFNKAIEYGFVDLAQGMMDQVKESGLDDA